MPKIGRSLIGIVAGFKSEWWPVFDRNAGRLHVGIRTVARQIGILPSQLYRWRRELLGSDEAGLAAPVDPQSVAPDPDPVVEIDIDGIVVRVGRHVEEAHLQRVIRAVRSA